MVFNGYETCVQSGKKRFNIDSNAGHVQLSM